MKALGIHSFVWTGGSTQQELDKAIRASAELGYQLIEFPRLDPKKFDVAWLARRLSECGLKVVVTLGLPLHCDVSSEDAETVARGEAFLDDAVRITRDLGGEKLGGIVFSAHTKYQTMPTRRGWKNSVEVLGRVAERAKRAGVSINLEIVNRFESNLLNTVAQGLKYIRESGSDNLFLHLDTFHMAIEECDPAAAVRLAGDKLGYLHLGENYRGALGTGTINFSAIFDALLEIGYDDAITFESFSHAVVDRDLSITCAIWRDTWKDNRELARQAKSYIEFEFAQAQARLKARRAACINP
ncbi:epimerase [Cephaloticoccus primus]|uniref:Epimerase n=1 Tax=Cephaloticoccus primus TaxID=1548207 RepID=A0A139STF9_9BACT|nr:epimerase [Cephaloticoccus primus]